MKILVLAALTDATGNAVTARRIASQLSPEHEVTLEDSVTASPDSLREVVKSKGIELAIGVHALLAGPFLRVLEIPYVLIFGGTDLYEQTHEMHQRQMAKAVAGAARLLAFSPENRARAEWLWPEARGRVECLPQAVEATLPKERFSLRERLGLQASDILVVLPTGIRRVKDPIHVVEAFSVWNVVEPRAHLAIVGAVLEPDYAASAMRALAERPGVHFVPALPRPQMLAAIAEADLVLNTSLSEGMCGVLLEAMCLGTPVVARRNAGNESLVVHGHTGLLYDSPSELVHWGRALVASTELRQRLATTARRRIEEQHSPAKERAAYLRIAQEAATSKKPTGIAGAPIDEIGAVVATGGRLGLSASIVAALEAVVARAKQEPELSAKLTQLGGLLATAPPSVAIAGVHEAAFDQSLGPELASTVHLALALMQVPAAEARILSRGVDPAIVTATLKDLASWAEHFLRLTGFAGITLEILEWAQRYLRGELVQLGPLQFDLRPFAFPTRVYRHKQTRKLSATTVDGRALDLVRGAIISERPPAYDPAVWEIALEPGSPILEMWFPGALSRITLRQVGVAMREAYALFGKLSPETVPVGVCGESWRLDPQLTALLPPDSGIREMQQVCALFPSALSEAKTIRRLFGPKVERADLAGLPQDKLNPVQRVVAEFLKSPNVSLRARGGFVLREEAEQQPQWK